MGFRGQKTRQRKKVDKIFSSRRFQSWKLCSSLNNKKAQGYETQQTFKFCYVPSCVRHEKFRQFSAFVLKSCFFSPRFSFLTNERLLNGGGKSKWKIDNRIRFKRKTNLQMKTRGSKRREEKCERRIVSRRSFSYWNDVVKGEHCVDGIFNWKLERN